MNTYLITFEDNTTVTVESIDRDGAQEMACDLCDQMGIVLLTITSIRRVR